MSIEAITIALNHSQAKGSAKLVLLGICNHINPDNDGAWPSQERLANYANISDRAVRYAVDQLIELNEIRVEIAAGSSKNQYKPNRYWLTLSCPDDCDKSASHRRVEKTDRVEEIDNQGGKNLQSGWKPTSDKPYIEPKEETVTVYAQNDFERMFNQFYQLYPRKTGKGQAIKAFRKALKSESFDTVLAGVIRLANDPHKPAKQFIPYPATWLNGWGWLNEPYPEREMSREERQVWEAAQADRNRESRLGATQQVLDEVREAERRAAENPAESCPHRAVKLLCKICG